MLKISIIAVGGLKDAFYRSAAEEYIKRLSAYCSPEEIEIPAARLDDTPSQRQIETALDSEGDKILAKLPKKCYVVAMCIEGKEVDSETLAQKIKDVSLTYGHIVFIIGGSYGLSDAVKRRADYRLSMSRMTFPHRLARVMLLEQLYRSFKINCGGTYHK